MPAHWKMRKHYRMEYRYPIRMISKAVASAKAAMDSELDKIDLNELDWRNSMICYGRNVTGMK